jgi:hypothetical protein
MHAHEADARWRWERRIFDGVLGRDDSTWRGHVLRIALAGLLFGAAMGSYDLSEAERLKMPFFAGIKSPLLVLATTLICLPGYFVLSTVLGLRKDLAAAFGSILAGQAAQMLALASLAPVLLFIYACGITHMQALAASAAMFTIATGMGYMVLWRRYRPLLAQTHRHRVMLVFWVVMYVFVGIQMGWMLRPFVGTPGMAVTFVRQEPFSNAYVAVAKILAGAVRGTGR